jgi:hypothetical protein
LGSGFTIASPAKNYFEVHRALTNPEQMSFLVNTLRMMTPPEEVQLSEGGHRLLTVPNAGGNSVWSEVMSFEVLRLLFGARLLRTEMEIEYTWNSKITDYAVVLSGHHLGVSVTRAMKFRGVFQQEDAIRLLRKKLYGVIRSTEGVYHHHRWEKQILHVRFQCTLCVRGVVVVIMCCEQSSIL